MLVLAALCLAVLVYTYLGYPLLIALLARLRPLRVQQDPGFEPTVTACIAVHHGAEHLDAKLRSLLSQNYPRAKLEILVYSDGATDGTETLVGAWAAREPAVKLLRGAERAGKPTALNRMREAATGEVLLLTDVRQPLDRRALRALCDRLADPSVGCVSGNLVLQGAAGSGAYWRYEKMIRRHEGRFRSLIGVTGAITLVRRSDLGELPADLVLDDVWIPMRLRLQGRRAVFAEEACAYDAAFDDDREFGRKVRTLAGNYQLFARLPALLSPFRNPSWFETISHRVLRLLCPWALLVMLVASLGVALRAEDSLARRLGTLLLGGQGLFYFGALLGPAGGKVFALARTFVVLNAAAVVGLWRFLRGRIAW
jgi:cellulose synthase/poly-beta-1,6-N-acetylglucosamine synthase-like glycosyltransferase